MLPDFHSAAFSGGRLINDSGAGRSDASREQFGTDSKKAHEIERLGMCDSKRQDAEHDRRHADEYLCNGGGRR
jgi:hypothetical protein